MQGTLGTFRLDRGIGRFQIADHFAVLGAPLGASSEAIRHRYLAIVKQLHPDIYGRTPEERQKATQLFARLVCPAYRILMQDRERVEFLGLIRLLGKRIAKSPQSIALQSAAAKQLIATPTDRCYEQTLAELAARQYESLDRALQFTNDISELNLTYVLLKEGYTRFAGVPLPEGASRAEPVPSSPLAAPKPAPDRPAPQPATKTIPNTQHAEALIAQKQWAIALKELRAILQAHPQHAQCHALLGVVYLNQKLLGMAKVSFQQALKFDPHNAIALDCLKRLVQDTETKPKKGGFFGWLGGG